MNLLTSWFELKTSQHKGNNVNLPASLMEHVFLFDLNAQTRTPARSDAFYILQLIAVTSCLRGQKEQRHKTELI